MHLAVVPVRLQFAQAATFRRLNLSSSTLHDIAAHRSGLRNANHSSLVKNNRPCTRHGTTRDHAAFLNRRSYTTGRTAFCVVTTPLPGRFRARCRDEQRTSSGAL